MGSDRDQEPTIKLARDEYTVERRRLEGHPEAVKSSSRIDVEDDYGNVATWNVDLYRLEGSVTGFLQRGAGDGYIRLLVPAAVTAAFARAQAVLVTKNRKKVARRVVADKRAKGEKLGNPDALAAARKRRKRPQRAGKA